MSQQPVQFLDARACAKRFGFSQRHWFRLVGTGRAPQPTRFGRLVRWHLPSLEQWESQGCPPRRDKGTYLCKTINPPN
jgi:predicted DNA-binding transcriptional regulator AlpA